MKDPNLTWRQTFPFSWSSSRKRIHLQCMRPQFYSWVGKIPWRRDRLPTPVFLGFPCGSAGKKSACNVGDLGSVPGLGRSPGEGKGYPLQYSGLENSMDCIIHGATKSQTQLNDFHFHFQGNKNYKREEKQRDIFWFSDWVIWAATGYFHLTILPLPQANNSKGKGKIVVFEDWAVIQGC